MSVVIDKQGQVIIPDEVREKLGLSSGSIVDFKIDEHGRAYLRKALDVSDRIASIERTVGSLKLGMTTDEFMALMRGDD